MSGTTEPRKGNGKANGFTYRPRTPEQWQKRAEQRENDKLCEWQDTFPTPEQPLPMRARKRKGDAPKPETSEPIRAASSGGDGALQENILTLLCFDTEACPAIIAAVDTSLFGSSEYRAVADKAVAYFRTYKKAPADHLPDLFEKELATGGTKARVYSDLLHDLHGLSEGINQQFVLDQLQEFVSGQFLRQSITTAAEALQCGNLQESIATLTKGLALAGNRATGGLTAGLLTDDELRRLDVPPVVDAVYPIIQFPGITFISGAFGSAKTFFALKCAMGIVSGHDFFNYHVGKPLSVAFMDFELPLATLKLRRNLVRQTFNGKIDTSQMEYWSAARCHAEGEPIANFADPAQIPGQLEKHDKHDVLFIDNLSHAMRGVDMNIAEAYDAMHEFTMQRKFAGKSTIIIQHLGKDHSKGPRGSSRQEDWPDVSLTLKRTIDDSRNTAIKVTCRKMRNHDESAFEPIEFELGNEDGKFSMTHRTLVESKSEKIKEEYRQLLEDDLVKRGTQKALADKYGVRKSLVSEIARKVTCKAKV